MRSILSFSLLAYLAVASPIGSTTADSFPPTGTTVNQGLFPDATAVGYPGPTVTGAEAYAWMTVPVKQFPKVQDGLGAVVPPKAKGSKGQEFDPINHWGNLSPRRSLESNTWGAGDATPIVPQQCELTQVHQLFRHGARYPSSSEDVGKFAARLNAAASNGTVTASGELAFLNNWTYKLGAEILNPFGRQQCYDLGVRSRMAYGHLLNDFVQSGKLPVFRTGSQDRMVETLDVFAQGFFGRNPHEQFSMEVAIEANGVNTTESPTGVCANGMKSYASIMPATNAFAAKVFKSTAARLNKNIKGYTITPSDVNTMIAVCAYETLSLGYSAFCPLFTDEEFKDYEYIFDLNMYYGFGSGSPGSAAIGKGWVQELVARLSKTPMTVFDSSTNGTRNGNDKTFPLDQSIYADATHDAYLLASLVAMDLNPLNGGALSLTKRDDKRKFLASKIIPFNTNLDVQVMSCGGGKKVRFILNDAVIPLHTSYDGCKKDADGLCALDTVVKALNKRLDAIDFYKVCSTNWTAPTTEQLRDFNGLPYW